MSVWKVALALISGLSCAVGKDYHATPYLQHIDEMPELAQVEGAGAHRGPHWYDYDTSKSKSDSDMKDGDASNSMSMNSHSANNNKKDSGASSASTKEKRWRYRAYRDCTPCPLDMIKRHTNIGIKWICGGYQRARRSFKSECMMRYRNCQDGTMFVKIHDHRCKDDNYHGRHWFYVYKV